MYNREGIFVLNKLKIYQFFLTEKNFKEYFLTLYTMGIQHYGMKWKKDSNGVLF